MRLIGFNFNKINVGKFSNKFKDLKVNTNIDIKDIKEINSNLFNTEEEFIGVRFNYEVVYDPKIAKIDLAGDVLFAVKSKISKEILKQWKDKEMPEDFRITLFNIILKKSNLKALQLEDEMNLPLHINMPSLKKQETKPKDK